ncbi:hypothetical protein Acsp06_07160 [Actinomycetospora sp. NBRC 106375]|uniref:hypothetical protein n=1 Tax=Actinomycetospora sp. NBRC 106375 TaxID=3032207 RepID=UPI0024A01304|nr:hypothetical protein [Actinomycetospora sp. NBRC 106375]GLZ44531.1 hypothetical protein Acsp06_07160 [Actinomycetospora sp. NBRC 106375]
MPVTGRDRVHTVLVISEPLGLAAPRPNPIDRGPGIAALRERRSGLPRGERHVQGGESVLATSTG